MLRHATDYNVEICSVPLAFVFWLSTATLPCTLNLAFQTLAAVRSIRQRSLTPLYQFNGPNASPHRHLDKEAAKLHSPCRSISPAENEAEYCLFMSTSVTMASPHGRVQGIKVNILLVHCRGSASQDRMNRRKGR